MAISRYFGLVSRISAEWRHNRVEPPASHAYHLIFFTVHELQAVWHRGQCSIEGVCIVIGMKVPEMGRGDER